MLEDWTGLDLKPSLRSQLPSGRTLQVGEFPEQFGRTQRFELGRPHDFRLTKGGETLFFRRTPAGNSRATSLWRLDTSSGLETPVVESHALDPHGQAKVDHTRSIPKVERLEADEAGVISYSVDSRGHRIAVETAAGLWVTDIATQQSPRMLPCRGRPRNVQIDPTGNYIAYSSAGSLWVIAWSGEEDWELLAPEENFVTYGIGEYVADAMRRRSLFWAPDGQSILVVRVDNSSVDARYLATGDFRRLYSEPLYMPCAGERNARVELVHMPLNGEPSSVPWAEGGYEYLVHCSWRGQRPLVAALTRDHKRLRIADYEVETGKCNTLHVESDPNWISVHPGVPCQTDSGALVRISDRGDYSQLLVGEATVSPPGWHVREVLDLDGDRVVFSASDDPTEIHVWVYEGGSTWRLTSDSGVHRAIKHGQTTVLISNTLASAVGVTIEVPGRSSAVSSVAESPIVRPDPTILTIGPGELRVAVYRPAGHKMGVDRPLPVIMDPYAGPGRQRVVRAQTWWGTVAQWIAEQGFVVIQADGRGTPGRSNSWERAIRSDLVNPILEDQLSALEGVDCELPNTLDLSRVGIRGWSFGGYLAALAVTLMPEHFHAAVAGAAVSNQRKYQTFWKERYLGSPRDNQSSYDDASLLTHAKNLKRPLLLIHGTADTNVTFDHTMNLSNALLREGIPHSVLPLPGVTHRPDDPQVIAGLLRAEVEFLAQWLQPKVLDT